MHPSGLARCLPEMRRRSVLLPEPLAPMRRQRDPCGSWRFRFSRVGLRVEGS